MCFACESEIDTTHRQRYLFFSCDPLGSILDLWAMAVVVVALFFPSFSFFFLRHPSFFYSSLLTFLLTILHSLSHSLTLTDFSFFLYSHYLLKEERSPVYPKNNTLHIT